MVASWLVIDEAVFLYLADINFLLGIFVCCYSCIVIMLSVVSSHVRRPLEN